MQAVSRANLVSAKRIKKQREYDTVFVNLLIKANRFYPKAEP